MATDWSAIQSAGRLDSRLDRRLFAPSYAISLFFLFFFFWVLVYTRSSVFGASGEELRRRSFRDLETGRTHNI